MGNHIESCNCFFRSFGKVLFQLHGTGTNIFVIISTFVIYLLIFFRLFLIQGNGAGAQIFGYAPAPTF